MPAFNLEATNQPLVSVLTVDIHKDDYSPKVEQKLKEYRKQASFKGFRPGQVPMPLLRQRVGNSILLDVVMDELNGHLNNYIKEQNIDYLGEPMLQAMPGLDIRNLQDLSFKFEIGLAPDFEIKGLDFDNIIDFYEIEVKESLVDEEIQGLRQRHASGFAEVMDVRQGDLLTVELTELDENGAVKEGGAHNDDAVVSFDDIQSEALRDQLSTATVGDSFEVNFYDLDKVEPKNLRRYLLGPEYEESEVNERFRLTINLIRRSNLPELNEEFFNKVFNLNPEDEGYILDLETFRDRVRAQIANAYMRQSRNLFQNYLFESLQELNQFDLPGEFLLRWFKSARKMEVKPEEVEGLYRDIRWQLMRSKLADRFEIEVTEDDVRYTMRQDIMRYFNNRIDPYGEYTESLISEMMKNKKEVEKRALTLLSNWVLEQAIDLVGKNRIVVDWERFKEIAEAHAKATERKTMELPDDDQEEDSAE